jgi:hypothetical protein
MTLYMSNMNIAELAAGNWQLAEPDNIKFVHSELD